MSRIGKIIRSLIIMAVTSGVCLLIVSLLTYKLSWQADTAVFGITVTYILSGFFGGLSFHWRHFLKRKQCVENASVSTEKRSLVGMLQETILVGTLFMGILLLLSAWYMGADFSVSGRVLTIWLLLVGSASLGWVLG